MKTEEILKMEKRLEEIRAEINKLDQMEKDLENMEILLKSHIIEK